MEIILVEAGDLRELEGIEDLKAAAAKRHRTGKAEFLENPIDVDRGHTQRVRDPIGLSATQVTTIALVVNELSTNAIKHAFEEDKGGSITVTLTSNEARDLVVLIDDDGLPFPDLKRPGRDGLGLELARRLMASIDGLFIPPDHGSKLFELRLPFDASW